MKPNPVVFAVVRDLHLLSPAGTEPPTQMKQVDYALKQASAP